jgi:hypothetical protein
VISKGVGLDAVPPAGVVCVGAAATCSRLALLLLEEEEEEAEDARTHAPPALGLQVLRSSSKRGVV